MCEDVMCGEWRWEDVLWQMRQSQDVWQCGSECEVMCELWEGGRCEGRRRGVKVGGGLA